MTLFEPLFLILAVTTLVTTAVLVVALLRGQRARAARIGRRLGLGIAAYVVALVVGSLLVTAPVRDAGSPLCFDDWCIELVSAAGGGQGGTFDVLLRLSNRARRQPMGERGTYVYVVDERGHRHVALPEGDEPPFSTVLQPGESVETRRRFEVGPGEVPRALFYAHSGFPIQWFVIGGGGWFQPPPSFRLASDAR